MMAIPKEAVKAIYLGRMPVTLTAADHDTWLECSLDEAARLLQPFPADRVHIAMAGGKADDDVFSPFAGQLS